MIEIKGLTKIFEDKQQMVTALQGVSITIEHGDIFGIIGMSGAGKSTLLRCLSLLEKPTSGQILLNGEDLAAMSGAQLRMARRKMGVVFQGYHLLMQKTVLDNIAFPLLLDQTCTKMQAKQRAMELLEVVGLADKSAAYPAQLSGGQKQRVAIARALATKPEILLCDEPTSALDPMTTKAMLKLLREINERMQVTIVIITHEMAVISSICNHVAVIGAGKVVEQGAAKAVMEHPASEEAKLLLGKEESM